MPYYVYEAIDKSNRPVNGILFSDSKEKAISIIESYKLTPTRVKEESKPFEKKYDSK